MYMYMSLAIYVSLSRSWLGWLPFFSFLFSYASVLNTCISMCTLLCSVSGGSDGGSEECSGIAGTGESKTAGEGNHHVQLLILPVQSCQ